MVSVEEIRAWLNGYGNGNGYGYGNGNGNGDGYGYGNGYGDGYGNGYGNGYGDGYGNGYGNGDGYGNGYGYGYGNGNGNGNGNGYGNGYGDGYGYGMKSIEGMQLFSIDGVPTAITRIIKDIAKGYVVRYNSVLVRCFVARDAEERIFAHGNTVKSAVQALIEKKYERMDIDSAIAEFVKTFDVDKTYSTKDFYNWHHYLTGSCEFGRQEFAKAHNVNLDGTMTVKEFITLTENAYGGEVIKRLKSFYGL